MCVCGVQGCYGVSEMESVDSGTSSASTEPWFCDACRAGVKPVSCSHSALCLCGMHCALQITTRVFFIPFLSLPRFLVFFFVRSLAVRLTDSGMLSSAAVVISEQKSMTD